MWKYIEQVRDWRE